MLAYVPGHWELLIILIIALLLFGSRLPTVMRSLGKSVTQFKKGLRDVEDEVEAAGQGDDESSGEDKPDLAG